MVSVPQTQQELQQHLEDHVGFLLSSCDAFDGGHVSEAKRLAVSLRVLLHDTPRSHSLLGQLNRLTGKFISSAMEHQPGNLGTHGGLIMTSISRGSRHFAPLDNVPWGERWLQFSHWWNEVIFVDGARAELTRRDLVLVVANQDGGAHVDPTLSDEYNRLSRHNSMGWIHHPGSVPVEGAACSAIRQVSHEILKTLIPRYGRIPKEPADLIFGGATLSVGGPLPALARRAKIGRNEPCPCGKVVKFKHCHGRI